MLKGGRKGDGREERGATEGQMEDLRREAEKELICSKLMVIALTYSPLQLSLSLVSDHSHLQPPPAPSPFALAPSPGESPAACPKPVPSSPLCSQITHSTFLALHLLPWPLSFPGGLDTSPDHSASLLQETIFLLLPPSSSHPYMNAQSPFKIIFCDFCYPQFVF